MPVLSSLGGLLKDPPPVYAFELSEAGVAAAELGRSPRLSFVPLDKDVLSVSPFRDNVLRPEALLAQIRALAPGDAGRKRRRAALILPDYAVRVTVLDFDSFPEDPREQVSLVRFRMKRSVPFEVDSAALSFYPQKDGGSGGSVEVAVAIAPLEVVARYEAPFRLAGFQVGLVTTSLLAASALAPPVGLKVLAKRTGRILSLAVLSGGLLRLIRTMEMAEFTGAEVSGYVHPTLAYVEDQFAAVPDVLLLCGFEDMPTLGQWLESEHRIRVANLTSSLGAPGECNAGLLGYLESLKES
jgi:type IV pilus assembly protein PilM